MIRQWVSKGGIDSFIEAAYLGVPVVGAGPERFIYINPTEFKYLIGNVVVINEPGYPESSIKWMIDNGIKVISRVSSSIEGIHVEPYILRVEFRVMWNGDTVKVDPGISYKKAVEILRDNSEVEDPDTGIPMKVYLPKLEGLNTDLLLDEDRNFTCLGWAMQEVGINVKTDIPYLDLDLLKTKKVILSPA